MKITYIKLENFIGIYAGTGRKILEIDFEKKNNNKIIMLLGKNGSGKTVLLSSLTPMRSNNDERDNFIIEGENGYKEVHITNNKDKFIIKHFYGKSSTKNKSFITKNGTELNENGNIRSFNEILFNELGLDDDFFRVGRLGSNITNFIDLKTAERKKFINKFIPNIDDYLEAFDIVKEKFSNLSRDIKVLKNQLDKFGDIEILNQNKEEFEKEISNINSLIDSIKEKRINILNRFKVVNKSIQEKVGIEEENDVKKFVDNLETKINKMENEINTVNNIISNIYSKYSKLESYTLEEIIKNKAIEEDLIERTPKYIEANKNERQEYQDKLNQLYNKEQLTKNKLNSLLVEDIEGINNIIETKKNELNIIKTSFDNLNINEKLLEIIENRSYALIYQRAIELFKEGIQTIKSLYTEEDITLAYTNYEKNLETLETIRKDIDDLGEERKQISMEISNIMNNTKLLDILDKRPKDCTDNTCPFIRNAYDYKENEFSKLESLNVKESSLSNQISSLKDKENQFSALCMIYKEIKDVLNKFLNSDKNDNIKKFINIILPETVNNPLEMIFNYSSLSLDKINVDNIIKYYDYENDIKTLEDTINKYNDKVESAKIALETYDYLQTELKTIEIDKREFNDKITLLNEEYEALNKKLSVANAKLKIFNDLYISITNKNILTEKYDKIINSKKDIEDFIKERSIMSKELDEFNNSLSNYESNINILNNKYENAKKSLYLANDIIGRINEIEGNFDNIKMIKEALDPKCGIPLIFIDNYLKDIAKRANELLSIAYNGQFMINFEVTSSDFFIKVIKADGTVLKDISEASQGEMSLTNISLSLAMIEKMIKKYNIIYLDEIDCTLSTENRRMFIQLLENQISKLNIEQVFIISHNNEFHTYPVDLILLKDNDADIHNKEFMEGKNIIFNIND